MSSARMSAHCLPGTPGRKKCPSLTRARPSARSASTSLNPCARQTPAARRHHKSRRLDTRLTGPVDDAARGHRASSASAILSLPSATFDVAKSTTTVPSRRAPTTQTGWCPSPSQRHRTGNDRARVAESHTHLTCAGDRLYVLSQAADVVARTDGDGGDALVGGQLDGEPGSRLRRRLTEPPPAVDVATAPRARTTVGAPQAGSGRS